MPDLAALQSKMALALFTGRYGTLADGLVLSRIGPSEALDLHRNTALHGLTNALRISYPTVDAMVGEAFFDQAALAFVQRSPPRGACLTGYGAGFAGFLADYELARDLPYLADVARLDFAVETVAGQSPGQDGPELDLGEAVLILDASVQVIDLDYPASAIRDAIENDPDALAAIDMTPRRHAVVLWRAEGGAAIRPLGPIAAAVLAALLGDGDIDAVLAGGEDLSSLQSDLFAAPFARLVAKST